MPVGEDLTRGRDSDSRSPEESGQMHRFRWRRAIERNPVTNQSYRMAVAIVGMVVVAAGLVMVPLVGPGWLVVFLGVAIWASEFDWAARLLAWGRQKLAAWNEWMKRKGRVAQALVGGLTFACVAGAMWLVLAVSGIPGVVPDPVHGWLDRLPGVD